MRVERVFHGAMQGKGRRGNGEGPPAFFGEADAVFTADGAAPGDDLAEEFIQGRLAAGFGAGQRIAHLAQVKGAQFF